ncbi:hypothetical protein BDQ12DRAFT_683249 [Crucibulum laeve]|uniref:Adenosine deaminase domain-containing protein n=1 Tax=Crucibulum laeve TaxID=68775 RepID=A0A5C3M3H9_9AGAR|nr:hypothetical protein BDQ12DRAFT_683249 [Crucibulum laeve]
MSVAGPAKAALDNLNPEQLSFIQSLPKAELHAHLNGSIPISILQELAREYQSGSSTGVSNEVVNAGIEKLLLGPSLDEISDFFALFPAIYALTSTPISLAGAARAVLSTFLDGEHPQCTYLELRSTPRKTDSMSREDYMRTILDEAERYPKDQVGVIVSLDRRMRNDVLQECLDVARKLKEEGRRVVGVDLCGDPMAGNMEDFAKYFAEAKAAGLGITLHIAETVHNTPEETMKLLSFGPDRLGHATFLNDEAKEFVVKNKICIEICLSSNLLCKTVTTLEFHHVRHYLKYNHPIAICTDDILPFRTSLDAEYALLLAPAPFGLGLSEGEVREAAEMSLRSSFRSRI